MTRPESQLFRRTLLRSALLPAGLLLTLAVVLLGLVQGLLSASRWVDHTDQVIGQAHQVQTLLIDEETGLRGFLLTGHREFLQPYESAARLFPSALTALTRLVHDNPRQVALAEEVERRNQVWVDYSRRMIALRSGDPRYAEAALNLEGKRQMDDLRGVIGAFTAQEVSLREGRTAAVRRGTAQVVAAALLLAIVLGIAAAGFVRRGLLALNGAYVRALDETAAKAEQLERIQRVTDTALAHLRLDDLLRETLARICDLLHSDTAALLLCDEGGSALTLRAARGLEEEMDPVRIPLGEGFAGRIAASGQALMLVDVQPHQIVSPVLRDRGVRSLLGVPLQVDGRVIGVIHVGSLTPRTFTEEESSLLSLVADRLALAIEHARLFQETVGQAAKLERRVRERTAELEESNAELQAFSYTISHDLRAPVRAIRGFTQALVEDYGAVLESEGRSYTEAILTSSERMDRLIEDLLTYSRLTRAQLRLHPVSLERVVRDSALSLPPEHQDAVTVEGPLPAVRAEAAILGQVVTNLLTNAVKFFPAGGRPEVRVWAERRGSSVRLWVEDRGIGIDPAHHARIFGVFERLHGMETYPGTGIGLAIVRRAVERMGGQAGVESALGSGSRFWVELPAVEGE